MGGEIECHLNLGIEEWGKGMSWGLEALLVYNLVLSFGFLDQFDIKPA